MRDHLSQQCALTGFHLLLFGQDGSQLLKHKYEEKIGTGEYSAQPCTCLSLPAEHGCSCVMSRVELEFESDCDSMHSWHNSDHDSDI